MTKISLMIGANQVVSWKHLRSNWSVDGARTSALAIKPTPSSLILQILQISKNFKFHKLLIYYITINSTLTHNITEPGDFEQWNYRNSPLFVIFTRKEDVLQINPSKVHCSSLNLYSHWRFLNIELKTFFNININFSLPSSQYIFKQYFLKMNWH